MHAFVVLVIVAAIQDAPPPFLGVQTGLYNETVDADGTEYAGGLLIIGVVADSAAEEAGLLSGDALLAIDGTRLDVPADERQALFQKLIRAKSVGDTLEMLIFRDTVITKAMLDGEPTTAREAWDNPRALIEPRDPGAKLELSAERVRAVLTLTATLRERPELSESARPMPASADIFAEPVPLPAEAALADELTAEYDVAEAYTDLRNRLAQLVEAGDQFRLSRVAYAMREPFAMPALSQRIAEMPSDLPGALRHAAEWTDSDPGRGRPRPLRTGLSPEEHTQQIARVLKNADRQLQKAFEALTADDREFLAEELDEFGDAFRDDIMILRDTDRERVERLKRFVELSQRVDRASLTKAALYLATLLDSEYLDALQRDLVVDGKSWTGTTESEFGPIVIAGPGDDWHQNSAAVLIDLGGDDWYTCAAARPFSVIIDVAGNDSYQATFPVAHGAGTLGVALLLDRGGDDRYITRRWSLGCGVLGVGVLIDDAGDDIYRGAAYSQAMAYCGTGLLIDRRGNDRYDAPRFAQALALPGGFAALLDESGDDEYYCKGRDLGAYGTPGVFAGWGQGCASGLRGLASGGIALLRDDAGDDVYEAGNFSQGGGYYFGWGCLVDRDGTDTYLGERYAQAFAAHQAIGFLDDAAGDDRYYVSRGVGQSCSWDQTITALLDHAGDDVYSGGGFGLCASAHNGFALMIDYAGRDTYRQHNGSVRAGGNDYHGGASLSLMLDLGGDTDDYAGDTSHNNLTSHAGEHGFFIDSPGDMARTAAGFREWKRTEK